MHLCMYTYMCTFDTIRWGSFFLEEPKWGKKCQKQFDFQSYQSEGIAREGVVLYLTELPVLQYLRKTMHTEVDMFRVHLHNTHTKHMPTKELDTPREKSLKKMEVPPFQGYILYISLLS